MARPNDVPPGVLALTGERTLPGVPDENYWYRRHESAYLAGIDLIGEIGAGARVLDAGCGEGYGSALLAKAAADVVGFDDDTDAVEHARRMYDDPDIPNLHFVTASLEDPPTIPEGPFDLVIALHVLDHLERPEVALDALARRLATRGAFYCATLNRLTAAGQAANPFLKREFGPSELVAFLRSCFLEVALWGLVHAGDLLEAETEAGANLPAALIDAAGAGQPAPLWASQLVPAVTSDDFAFVSDPNEVAAAFDLVALARSPHWG